MFSRYVRALLVSVLFALIVFAGPQRTATAATATAQRPDVSSQPASWTSSYICPLLGQVDSRAYSVSIVQLGVYQPAPPAQGTVPRVVVRDQPVFGSTIMVDEAVAPQEGWLVVHEVSAEGKPIVHQAVGKIQIPAGASTSVSIKLTEPVQLGDQLTVMLHIDEGVKGSYEFPSGADLAVKVADQIVTTAFNVIANPQLPVTGLPSASLALLIGVAFALVLFGAQVRRVAPRYVVKAVRWSEYRPVRICGDRRAVSGIAVESLSVGEEHERASLQVRERPMHFAPSTPKSVVWRHVRQRRSQQDPRT